MIVMIGRYATDGPEGKIQPGSRGRVLANRLGIVRVREMQIAETSALLQLTHEPFREGNGRLARLLNTMMALQAGWPPLDFGGIRGAARRRYIAGIHAAQGGDYASLGDVFATVLRRTWKTAISFSSDAAR